MPTPHGDQGMAFSAHEVRVLRRALTVALRGGPDSVDFWLLGRAIAEAHDERERLRTFMAAELRRYRAALPGSAAGFLSCLRTAVDEAAHIPSAEDLAALRTAVDLPCGARERASRAALLRRCTRLAEAALEQRLTARAHHRATRASGPDPLDILIPGRPRIARTPQPRPTQPEFTPNPTTRTPALTPGSTRTPPATRPDPQHTTHHKHQAPTPLEPAKALTPAVPKAPEPRTPEALEPEVAEPEVRAAPKSETLKPKTLAPEAPEAPEPKPADPAAKAPDPEAPRIDSAPHEQEPTSADATPPDASPSPEPLSPVIPHRRQGRALGQLPTPEILQTGTG
ncbi:hypothetical protein [Embleya sp. AB8]|uniref:hypothetical protein n=1 Tax=Embleya sp. AB8 TaxID=3156304 RepID=UPI003C77EBF0